MAKGLFTVYSDPHPPLTTSKSKLVQKQQHHQHHHSSRTPSIGGTWNGKENFDPFAKTNLKDLSNQCNGGKGKGKRKSECGSENHGSCSMTTTIVPTTSSRTSLSASSTLTSSNGICTGTLRKRSPPPLEPLDSTPPTTKGRSKRPLPTLAKDGQSQLPMSVEEETEELSDSEANRRARMLTESPLAEITEAHNLEGNFSFIPSPLSFAVPTSLPVDSSPPRKTTSPPRHHNLKVRAPIAKPYEVSKSKTTRKRKEGSSDVLEKELKAMRV